MVEVQVRGTECSRHWRGKFEMYLCALEVRGTKLPVNDRGLAGSECWCLPVIYGRYTILYEESRRFLYRCFTVFTCRGV